MIGDRIENALSWLCLIALAVAMIGCASLTQPETPAQTLAYTDTQFTALVETAADLREQDVLDADDIEAIDPIIRRGNEALTLAWQALGNDHPQTALDYVSTVNRLLIALSQQLQEARDDNR